MLQDACWGIRLRAIVLSLCLCLLGGCGLIAKATGWTRPVENPQNVYVTASGLRIEFNRRDIFRHYFEDGDFQIERVNLIDRGHTRINPYFDIAKPGIERDLALDADRLLDRLDDIMSWTDKSNRDSLPPERVAYLNAFYDQALGAMIESALAFEAAKTPEDMIAEFTAMKKKIEDFRTREPDTRP